ncbi:unnamed protein product [Didymodactylos carnosus]|uniref:Uncharacterized protein n=1 Tax=Didymodactylos carnosus TaxID=1234261 RepID=A0A8S2CRG8_9BILA|nr:unnamed protein product [Didymodactylos carnosus]CAF3566184.1 unnamed protein product [Didymodactylos carnosus]
MYSDSECTHNSRSMYSHRTQSTKPSTPHTIQDILNNPDTLTLLIKYLTAYGKRSLGEFCAVVIGLREQQQEQQPIIRDIVRAAYKQYIENLEQSSYWLLDSTREQLYREYKRGNYTQYIFDQAFLDAISYIQQNFYSNFLSSNLWTQYLKQQQQLQKSSSITTLACVDDLKNINSRYYKNIKLEKSSISTKSTNNYSIDGTTTRKTPKKLNLSLSAVNTRLQQQHTNNSNSNNKHRELSFNTSKTIHMNSSSSYDVNDDLKTVVSHVKTPLACFIPGSDVPFMVYLPIPVTQVTLKDVKPRINQLASTKLPPSHSKVQCHYYFKRRVQDNELWLDDNKTQFIYEEIEQDLMIVPNLGGTIVAKLDY